MYILKKFIENFLILLFFYKNILLKFYLNIEKI